MNLRHWPREYDGINQNAQSVVAVKAANQNLIDRGIVVDYGGSIGYNLKQKVSVDSRELIEDEAKETAQLSEDDSFEYRTDDEASSTTIKTKDNEAATEEAKKLEQEKEDKEENKLKEKDGNGVEPRKEVKEKDYGIAVQNEVIKIIQKMADEDLKEEMTMIGELLHYPEENRTKKNKELMNNEIPQDLQTAQIVEKVKSAFTTLYADDWKEYNTYSTGEKIETNRVNGYTVYRGQVTLDVSVEKLVEILYDKFVQQPVWNKSYRNCKVIAKIDENTDVTYREVVLPLWTAVRDYVTFRHRSKFGNVVMFVTMSMDCYCDPMLETTGKKPLRAYIGPSCSVMKPVENNPNQCTLMVLIDSDLKGNLNRMLPDWVISRVQAKYMSNLREYLATLSP